MNTKRLILTIIVVFVVANLLGFLIHAYLLRADYMLIAQHYRAVGEEKMPFIILAYLSYAIGSVWIYAKGVEDRPWLEQGVRFGIAIALVLAIPSFFIAYAVQPVPSALMVKQVMFETVGKVILGIVTAAIYRK